MKMEAMARSNLVVQQLPKAMNGNFCVYCSCLPIYNFPQYSSVWWVSSSPYSQLLQPILSLSTPLSLSLSLSLSFSIFFMDLPMKRPISGNQRTHYSIEARNLCYKISESFDGLNWLYGGGSSKRGPKFILKNVNCEARAGEITAIAGPSGAGKTTLLEILGGNIPLRKISGQVLVNDQHMLEKTFPRISGYVKQDAALFPLLTVEETLMYSALLRLAGGRKETESRVGKLMKDLGLENVAASRVGGGSNRGISGGERRRVSIGVELVHDPAVILIDEPTSGLDSVSALHVMSVLRRMVNSQGKTVLLTIHQPGFRILELFDRLILLSNGVVMHNGSLNHLEERLKLANHQIPHHVNVLEFAIDVVDSLAMHTSETFNKLHYLPLIRRLTNK